MAERNIPSTGVTPSVSTEDDTLTIKLLHLDVI